MNPVWFVLPACLGLFLPLTPTLQESHRNLRVMSFNIRLGTANDGDNHWNHRKSIVVQLIKDVNPDVVGTQETMKFQAEYLQQQLADYTYFGRSRQADPLVDEQCGILFRKNRFAKLAGGHFWLSETPDKPGSKSWDSSLPRMASWLHLWDESTGTSFYVINTHFDHYGKQARLESARLIRKFVNHLPLRPQPVVVTGDFNAHESSPPYQALFNQQSNEQNELMLQDTFRIHRPNRTKAEGTFGGFNGKLEGARIDWIACSKDFRVVSADIVVKSYEDRFPSDHYPVTADLEIVVSQE